MKLTMGIMAARVKNRLTSVRVKGRLLFRMYNMEMGPLSPALGLQGIFGKGRVQGHHRDHQHQQRHVGQQQAFCSEAHRLLAARNAGQGIGQRPQPTAEAVRHVHPGGDELHRHGVQQRIGVQLQNAQGQEDQGGAPEAGAGGVEYHIHPRASTRQAFSRRLIGTSGWRSAQPPSNG